MTEGRGMGMGMGKDGGRGTDRGKGIGQSTASARRLGLAPALAPALALALALAAPLAGAAPARVALDEAGGAWNGVSEAAVADGAALVWVPTGARIHAVTIDGAPAAWQAWGRDALRVQGEGATARVAFDVTGAPLVLARYVAPDDVELDVTVAPPPGRAVVGFEEADGRYHKAATLAAGDELVIRVVDAARVGELSVLATVGGLSLVVLALGVAWHRVRPPATQGGSARFLDHLQELQQRLLPPVLAFAVLNLFYFVAGLRAVRVGDVPLVAPVLSTEASLASRAYEAIAERLVPAGVELVALRPVDAILAQVQVCIFLAFATVLPLLAYEVAAFVAPALLPRERRLVARTIPLVLVLFALGAAFGFLLMAPLMVRTLYDYAPAVGARPLLGVGDLVSFALLVSTAFALAFELPIAMYALARGGIVRAATFRRYARHAIVIIFVAAGILTPDPSVVSQLLVGVPVTALYALGILAAKLGGSRRARRSADAVPAST